MSSLPARTWLLLPAGAALLGGLDGALLRLGVLAPVRSDRVMDVHGPLMVLGFLGTLIALERAVALRAGWAYAAPALLGTGAMALLSPAPLPVGQVLLLDGCAVLVAIYVALWRRNKDTAVLVELLGAVAACCAAVLWLQIEVPALLPWLSAFIILTIAAERIELARLHLPPGADRILLAASVALVVTAVTSVLAPALGSRAFGLALLLTAAWLARHDVARRLVRSSGLPRFSAAAMLLGYGWLLLAAFGWIALGRPTSGRALDGVVHATFLGFAMSMVLAHAAVIFPAIIRRPVPYRPILWIPLGMLHIGLIARILLGDLAGIPGARTLGSVVTVLALLALPLTVVALVLTGNRRRPAPLDRPVEMTR